MQIPKIGLTTECSIIISTSFFYEVNYCIVKSANPGIINKFVFLFHLLYLLSNVYTIIHAITHLNLD